MSHNNIDNKTTKNYYIKNNIYKGISIMKILDRSNYFRGLLLLAKKDNEIPETERNLVISAGKGLGFDKSFCEEAIDDILINEYISDEPPVFSSKDLALSFIRDSLKIAISDNNLDPNELKWIKSCAIVNNITDEIFYQEVVSILNMNHLEINLELIKNEKATTRL